MHANIQLVRTQDEICRVHSYNVQGRSHTCITLYQHGYICRSWSANQTNTSWIQQAGILESLCGAFHIPNPIPLTFSLFLSISQEQCITPVIKGVADVHHTSKLKMPACCTFILSQKLTMYHACKIMLIPTWYVSTWRTQFFQVKHIRHKGL